MWASRGYDAPLVLYTAETKKTPLTIGKNDTGSRAVASQSPFVHADPKTKTKQGSKEKMGVHR